MNVFGIDDSSNLAARQAFQKQAELAVSLQGATSREEITATVGSALKEYYTKVGKPFFKPIYPDKGGLPIAEHYNANCTAIYNDLNTISGELGELAQGLVDQFNYCQTKKINMENKINYIASLCSDYAMSANLTQPDIFYINENFDNTNKIQTSSAHVDPRVGVLTLARSSSTNRSKTAKVSSTKGNGFNGNYHMTKTELGITTFLSTAGAHDQAATILDDNPDTWFEYQILRLKDICKEKWLSNLNWATAKVNDILSLTILIELSELEDINWININPYLPNESSKVVVKLIRTSEDGTNYKELYNNNLILNTQLNSTSQTFRNEDITSDMYNIPNKFKGQGVWTFDNRQAKFVEIVLEQSESYTTNLGHYKYTKVLMNTDGTVNKKTVIDEATVTSEIREGAVGKYPTGINNEHILKEIEYDQGWRHCIGIKDIGIYSYKYEAKSEIVTKPYSSINPIKEISLYTKEHIPESFLADFKKINSWITYEISLDGSTFYPISPMHRNPVGAGAIKTWDGTEQNFPPKIYEINPTNSYEVQQKLFYKGYIETEKAPHTIQLKITMYRPVNIEDVTPVLDSFTLAVRTEVE